MAHLTKFRAALQAAMLIAAAAGPQLARPANAQEGIRIPPPAVDETAPGGGQEVAVFAGGCFWGIQGVFQHVDGVGNAISGYAGGSAKTAQYQVVGTGQTGHAESVQITYDPSKITYGKLLQIFFSVAHDPTQVDRQGPDVGSQYRTAIFPQTGEQAAIAKSYISDLNQAKVFRAAIATRIELGRRFYPAEAYHQDFLTLHPTYPYIVYNDLPKIAHLKALFPDYYRDDPVLVSEAKGTN